jgi:hypothetical protein
MPLRGEPYPIVTTFVTGSTHMINNCSFNVWSNFEGEKKSHFKKNRDFIKNIERPPCPILFSAPVHLLCL